MKVTITRKVKFVNPVIGLTKGTTKAESITNQYNLEGNIEEIEFMLNHLWSKLNTEFTQIRQLKPQFTQMKRVQ